MTAPSTRYSRSAFFDDIVRWLRAELPEELRQFQVRKQSHLIKLFYQNERVHFEVWVDSLRSQIEVGLDFEDGAESTAAYLAFFDQRIVEIKAQTGPALDFERWTKSWAHFVEVYPIEPFDRQTARTIAQRLTVIVSVLQPLVEEAQIPPGEHRSFDRPYWRHKRRS